MSEKHFDEEYYKKQSNIYSLLFQAYMDKYFLESVEHFKANIPPKTTGLINNAIFVVAHICELAKKDLALTLWKTYYDDSGDANTVKQLNRYLFMNHQIKYKIVETENIKRIRSTLSSLRHGFIAHNLMDNDGRELQVMDIISALEDIRKIFNDLCFNTIDSRVFQFVDEKVYSISFYEKLGLDPLLTSVFHLQDDIEKGE